MSVSLFLPCKWVHLYHFSRFHTYALIYDIYFSLSDFTLTISRSILVSANGTLSFLLWLSNNTWYIDIYSKSSLFIPLFLKAGAAYPDAWTAMIEQTQVKGLKVYQLAV